ncbi:MULE transposase family protein OS=Microvirga lotononidis GN=MicloDRAFT_00051370 PE=4 SV=1 [Gemmata massiliana]|uniref:MULE transposase family protein n=1 Tax=Gemmata massiliana TaxID=1210884 RepID=A0A6P2D052_9BACT|nr:MULE transposase family protein OS=Microvirga lotononidis GN=MicloDRAFT_00051370 PE=4 SV=1 [Gemmata massiliana]
MFGELKNLVITVGIPRHHSAVTVLLDRYDGLRATSLTDGARRGAQGKGIRALDGSQPNVGHEILWVIRDVLGDLRRPAFDPQSGGPGAPRCALPAGAVLGPVRGRRAHL